MGIDKKQKELGVPWQTRDCELQDTVLERSVWSRALCQALCHEVWVTAVLPTLFSAPSLIFNMI